MLKKEEKVNEQVAVNEGQVEQEVKQEVVKVTDWKQFRTKNKETTIIPFEFPDGSTYGVEIQALSKATFNALNEKYEDMKKPKANQVINKITHKWVDAPEDSPEYKAWLKENREIDNAKAIETVILALVNKPEGDTFEEQVAFIQDTFKSGQLDNLIIEIYKFSGYDLDKQINAAKNS